MRTETDGFYRTLVERSLTHSQAARSSIVSIAGLTGLADVAVLPSVSQSAPLTYKGRRICNTRSMLVALQELVDSLRVEMQRCTMCGEIVKTHNLRTACGRSECHERVCRRCRDDWYRQNQFGRVINVVALACAFCKKQPKTAVGTFYFNYLIQHLGNNS